MQDHDGVLAGVRVIDCGTFIAGPAAATVMSDFGAEVIKIERPPFGDPYRYLSLLPGMPVSEHPYCWILTGRNKKSLALNLAEEAGREVLLIAKKKPAPSPEVGQHTEEVLRELGYGDEAIDRLLDQKIVSMPERNG